MIGIGTKVGDRYEIIGNIGKGGMANVYLATDLILNREVAVKVLRFDFQNDQDSIRRFQREALAATELVHPNIVSVYDVGEENGMQYIVMEYVEGTDLKKYIKDYSPIALETIIDIMGQILSAIALAHAHQIIHRDLKPQNVLVDQDGTVKITDFGIAIALSETSLTQTNTLLGSVHYLSPEQARGGMATRQTDIYALGVILYELLIGSVPFEGESAVSIALKHFQNDIPSIRSKRPDVPQALENVVLKATAKEASDRYKTVNEMYADLTTTLSPDRVNEPRFEPTAMFDETIMLNPVEEPISSVSSQEKKENENQIKPKELKKKSKKKLTVTLIIIALIICIFGGLFALGKMSSGDVRIPDVVGKTEAEAIKLIQDDHITVKKVENIQDDSIEEGLVVKTNPAVGTSVKKNSGNVTIFVSSGKKAIKMSNYVGQDSNEARDNLLEKGFQDGNITINEEYSDSVKAGQVIRQTPKANREVIPSEQKVELLVSRGAETFTLENMAGYSKYRAESYLSSVGLVIGGSSEEHSDEIPKGDVLYTIPNSAAEVSKGTPITIVYSAGPAPAPAPTPSSSQPASTAPSSTTSETTTPPSSSTSSTTSNSEPDKPTEETEGNGDS